MPATRASVDAPCAVHHARKPLEPASPPSESMSFFPRARADFIASSRPGASNKSVVEPPPFAQIPPGSDWMSAPLNDRNAIT
jgi:hypothetical protein